MVQIGVRQSLEIDAQEFMGPFRRMLLTDECVRAAETLSLVQDALRRDLCLHQSPKGGRIYYYGPLQKDGKSILKFVGSSMDYTVRDARTKAEWFAERITLRTIERRLRRSMRIENVVREYLQETDPDCPDLLLAFFDHCLVPDYGHSWLSRIDTKRWLSLIIEASKDQPTCKFLHRNIKVFLSWAVRRRLLRRNPLSGTSVVKPASLAD
jgi:hypothetical protein